MQSGSLAPAPLPPAPQLPPKVDVLAWSLRLTAAVDEQFQSEAKRAHTCRANRDIGGSIFGKEAAISLWDRTLVDLLCGLHVPPMRLTSLLDIQVDYQSFGIRNMPALAACPHVGCTRPACKGNRLVQLAAVWEEGSSAQPPTLRLTADAQPFYTANNHKAAIILEHHKEERLRPGPITFPLPQGLCYNLATYMHWALPTLSMEGEKTWLLPHPNDGRKLDHQSLGSLWRSVQEKYHAPWCPFTPRQARHVYASHALEAVAAEVAAQAGQHLAGDAYLMGNTVGVLMGSYVPDARAIHAAAAVQRVANWREEAEQHLQAMHQQQDGDETMSEEEGPGMCPPQETESEWEEGATTNTNPSTCSISSSSSSDEEEGEQGDSPSSNSESCTSAISSGEDEGEQQQQQVVPVMRSLQVEAGAGAGPSINTNTGGAALSAYQQYELLLQQIRQQNAATRGGVGEEVNSCESD